jgi:hypothetical protein
MKNKSILFFWSVLLLASVACTVGQVGGAAVVNATITPLPTVAQVGASITPSARPTILPSITPMPSCRVNAGIDGGAVNVRACPGVECAIVGNVFDGDALLLLEGGEWAQIQAGDLTGFLNSKFCEVQK